MWLSVNRVGATPPSTPPPLSRLGVHPRLLPYPARPQTAQSCAQEPASSWPVRSSDSSARTGGPPSRAGVQPGRAEGCPSPVGRAGLEVQRAGLGLGPALRRARPRRRRTSGRPSSSSEQREGSPAAGRGRWRRVDASRWFVAGEGRSRPAPPRLGLSPQPGRGRPTDRLAFSQSNFRRAGERGSGKGAIEGILCLHI